MDALQKYYGKLCVEYDDYLRRLQTSVSAENIHEVRVIIKKIRSLYHLLAAVYPSFDFEKKFKQCKHVFKAAGKIRDIDISVAAIEDLDEKSPTERKKLVTLLLQKRRKSIPKIKKLAKESLRKNDSDRQENAQLLLEIQIQDVIMFLERTAADIQIQKEKSKHIPSKRLHGIRKLSKEYLYIAEASDHKDKFPERMDKLQKRIGEWHNLFIAAGELDQFGKAADDLLGKIKKEEKKLKKKGIKELKAIVP